MASILDLPGEVIVMILKYADFSSVHNFCEASKQFKRYYRDSQVVKHVEYDKECPIPQVWVALKKYLILNKNYITHLNIHSIILKKSEFLISLRMLNNLEYLNIVETGLVYIDIQHIAMKLEKLRSISVSYYGSMFITIPRPILLEKVHVVLDRIYLPELWANIHLANFQYLKIEYMDCDHYTNLSLHIPKILGLLICPEIVMHRIPMMQVTMKTFLDNEFFLSRFKYVFIETASQMYLPKDICPELEEDAFVVRWDSLEEADLFMPKYIMSIYVLRADYSVSDMERYIRRRDRIKRQYQIMPPRHTELQLYIAKETENKEAMLSGKLHPVVQHICDKGTYRQMIFNEDHFLTQSLQSDPDKPSDCPDEKDSLPQKKPRVSHIMIPKLSTKCIFEEALEKNTGVSSLNVVQTRPKIDPTKRGSDGNLYVYNFESLNNITQLKYLVHLRMNVFPNNCHNFARLLFENCHELESLQVSAYEFYKVEPFSEHLHLSKKIRIVLFQTSMRKIDRMLLDLSSVPTLRTVALFDLALVETGPKLKISRAVLEQVLDKLKKLSYLYVYQENMPVCWKTGYSKMEKSLRSKYKNRVIHLTNMFTLSIRGHYNINFPLKNNIYLRVDT